MERAARVQKELEARDGMSVAFFFFIASDN